MEMKDLSKYWGVVTYLVCGLLIILPMTSTFYYPTEESQGVWVNQSVYNTFTYTLVIGPWILLWIILPKLTNRNVVKVGVVVMLVLYALSFFFAVKVVLTPIQDLVSSWGAELLMLICPLILMDAYSLWNGI